MVRELGSERRETVEMTWLSLNLAICWNIRPLALIKRSGVESDATRKSENAFSADNQQGRLKDARD